MTAPSRGGPGPSGSSHGTDVRTPVRVADGVWRMAVPLPGTSLGYVLVYVIEGEDGAYAIDTGWYTEESYRGFRTGLEAAGYHLTDLRGLLITHVHPDHYGLARRLREETGAWVGIHEADAQVVSGRFYEPDVMVANLTCILRRAGAPGDQIEMIASTRRMSAPLVSPVVPDRVFGDGDDAGVPGRRIDVVWTPGHSSGHSCFWMPGERLLFTGDHVLPRITPNVPYHPWLAEDSLTDYLGSLDRLEGFPARITHPAHEYPVADLHVRLSELRAHHRARFAEILGVLDAHTDVMAWVLASELHWSRPWDQMHPASRRLAVGEVMAHLVVLVRLGLVTEADPRDDSAVSYARSTDREGPVNLVAASRTA